MSPFHGVGAAILSAADRKQRRRYTVDGSVSNTRLVASLNQSLRRCKTVSNERGNRDRRRRRCWCRVVPIRCRRVPEIVTQFKVTSTVDLVPFGSELNPHPVFHNVRRGARARTATMRSTSAAGGLRTAQIAAPLSGIPCAARSRSIDAICRLAQVVESKAARFQ